MFNNLNFENGIRIDNAIEKAIIQVRQELGELANEQEIHAFIIKKLNDYFLNKKDKK